MSRANKKLRKRLHTESPLCRKCNKPTTLELIIKSSGGLRHDVATIEHIHPKGHPDRNMGIKTLYCQACNKAAAEYYDITGGKLYSEYEGQPWSSSLKKQLREEYGRKNNGTNERFLQPDGHIMVII